MNIKDLIRMAHDCRDEDDLRLLAAQLNRFNLSKVNEKIYVLGVAVYVFDGFLASFDEEYIESVKENYYEALDEIAGEFAEWIKKQEETRSYNRNSYTLQNAERRRLSEEFCAEIKERKFSNLPKHPWDIFNIFNLPDILFHVQVNNHWESMSDFPYCRLTVMEIPFA